MPLPEELYTMLTKGRNLIVSLFILHTHIYVYRPTIYEHVKTHIFKQRIYKLQH